MKPALRILILTSFLLPALLPAADQAEVGLTIGQKAPDFALKDQNGKDVALDALLKQGPVAVVFYRSADWCMFCKIELRHLQRNLKKIEATGGHIVGVSYDSTAVLKRFSLTHHIELPLLSDPSSKIIDAYHVRDGAASDATTGVANHAVFVLDQKGIVRAKYLNVMAQEEPGVGFLLKALKDARDPEQKVQISKRYE